MDYVMYTQQTIAKFMLRMLIACVLMLFTFTIVHAQESQAALATQQASDPIAQKNEIVAETPFERGRRLTIAADCYACHTSDDNYPYAGGNGIPTPFGTLYPPNITPDKKTGIGLWSDEEFYNALHNGKNKKGQHLYPAMPYDSYTLISKEDAKLIKDYLFSQQAVQQQNRENELKFPFNVRGIMIGWNLFNFKGGEFKPDPAKSEKINRGAYLSAALGHCSTCHTPRNLTMGSDNSRNLAGDVITTGWYAPNITPDAISGIGLWKDEELAQYLKTGYVQNKSNAAGPMAEVIDKSLSKLPDDDIDAIIAWLRDQPAIRNKSDADQKDAKGNFGWGSPHDFTNTLRQSLNDYSATPSKLGVVINPSTIYYGACASCHGIDGTGVPKANFPSLVNNSALGQNNAFNVALVILNGVNRPAYQNDPEVFMPAYKNQFSDEEIAALTNWLFKNFGRPTTQITPSEVAKLRIDQSPIELPILAIAKSASIAVFALLVIFMLGAIIRYYPKIKALFSARRRKKYQMEAATRMATQYEATRYQKTRLATQYEATRYGKTSMQEKSHQNEKASNQEK